MVDMVIQSLFLKSSIPFLGKDWGVGHGHTEPSSEKLSTSSRTGKGWCAGLVLSLPHRSSALSLLGKGRVPHIVPEDRVDGVYDHDHLLCSDHEPKLPCHAKEKWRDRDGSGHNTLLLG